jgi:hypothetical protein
MVGMVNSFPKVQVIWNVYGRRIGLVAEEGEPWRWEKASSDARRKSLPERPGGIMRPADDNGLLNFDGFVEIAVSVQAGEARLVLPKTV